MKVFTDSMQNESPSELNSESSAGLEPLDPAHRHLPQGLMNELIEDGNLLLLWPGKREGRSLWASGGSADNGISNKIDE